MRGCGLVVLCLACVVGMVALTLLTLQEQPEANPPVNRAAFTQTHDVLDRFTAHRPMAVVVGTRRPTLLPLPSAAHARPALPLRPTASSSRDSVKPGSPATASSNALTQPITHTIANPRPAASSMVRYIYRPTLTAARPTVPPSAVPAVTWDASATACPLFAKRRGATQLIPVVAPAIDCAALGLSRRRRPVMLIDTFLFTNEVEVLLLRLLETGRIVDKVVILEAGHTFTGRRRDRRWYPEHAACFKPWQHLIEYRYVDDYPDRHEASTPWEAEKWFRNRLGIEAEALVARQRRVRA